MKQVLRTLRKNYFKQLAEKIKLSNVQFILLTHVLDDRPELVDAINSIAPIALIIAIPYSKHPETLAQLKTKHKVETPTLEELYNGIYLHEIILKYLLPEKSVVILEIGGYFSKILNKLGKDLGHRLLGVIEDTEQGHREYEKMVDKLPCPVISVARSELKDAEDFLVGTSCLYSTEKLMRLSGFPIEGKRSLVLGFGKIGRGMAHALIRRHCPVFVYDIDPIKRVNAISQGFQTPDKGIALQQAELIYGATGHCSLTKEDLPLLRNGAVLVSCSSKDVEFDLQGLQESYERTNVFDNFDKYENNGHTLYLLAEGCPVNFVDGAVIGPILTLVQSEIILAIGELLKYQGKAGLFKLERSVQQFLAETWLKHFCDNGSGHYRHV